MVFHLQKKKIIINIRHLHAYLKILTKIAIFYLTGCHPPTPSSYCLCDLLQIWTLWVFDNCILPILSRFLKLFQSYTCSRFKKIIWSCFYPFLAIHACVNWFWYANVMIYSNLFLQKKRTIQLVYLHFSWRKSFIEIYICLIYLVQPSNRWACIIEMKMCPAC